MDELHARPAERDSWGIYMLAVFITLWAQVRLTFLFGSEFLLGNDCLGTNQQGVSSTFWMFISLLPCWSCSSDVLSTMISASGIPSPSGAPSLKRSRSYEELESSGWQDGIEDRGSYYSHSRRIKSPNSNPSIQNTFSSYMPPIHHTHSDQVWDQSAIASSNNEPLVSPSAK